MSRDERLDAEQSSRLTRARILGAGRDISIYLDDGELARLLSVVASDNGREDLTTNLPTLPQASAGDYYRLPLSWFAEPTPGVDLVGEYLRFVGELRDFDTYFECLCELHKRRKKYAIILRSQPLPKMLQVSPRALLEFGGLPVNALASWMTWRKWFFDIDNRAGQEAGYLFEPILTRSLGGEWYSAKASPIRRATDEKKGRQVDCIVGRDAYEFKLRVTIAASGQGRFGEEIAFAEDCRRSRYRPVLLVLDPTPNPRLRDLVAAFERHGGEAHLGDAAWEHLERKSGPTMARFVERYARRPIAELDKHAPKLLDLSVSAGKGRKAFTVRFGPVGGHEWVIPRDEDPGLTEGDGD